MDRDRNIVLREQIKKIDELKTHVSVQIEYIKKLITVINSLKVQNKDLSECKELLETENRNIKILYQGLKYNYSTALMDNNNLLTKTNTQPTTKPKQTKQTKQTKQLNRLKEKYTSCHGKRPRGRSASDKEWLKQQIKKKKTHLTL